MRLIVAVCLCLLVVVENLVVGLSTQEDQEQTTITPVLDDPTNSNEESTNESLEDLMPTVEAEYETETSMPVTEDSEEHLLPNTEDVDETETNKPAVLENERLVDDGEEVEMPIRHVVGETDTGGSGVDAEDTTDDTLEITVPIRHGENETESKEPVSEDLEQDYDKDAAPVRHVENEGDDALYEYGELQHDYDYENMTPEERIKLRKKCKPRHPCKDLGGKCRRRKAGCGAGNFIYESTHNVKYCNKRSCVCCVPVVRCKANNKCSRQNGKCIWEGERCAGKVKKGKAFCGGKDCVCCIPKKPQPISCLTKYACHDLKGTCINLWKETCDTKILTGNQFCKGKDCGCCLSTMPVTTDSTTTTDSSATTDKPSNPIKWSYHGNTGPEYWSSTYPLCIGERQSPIDFNIPAMEEKWMEPFWLKNYDTVPTTITMSNNGHSVVIMVEMPGDLPQFTGGGLNGTYYFRQAHIHWGITSDSGSEHMMSTKSEEAELHLVHYKGDYGSIAAALEHGDGLAVLGVMIHLGYEEHPVFKYITPQLKHIIEPKMSINLTTPFPLRQLLPDDLSMFYRYKGSLTTPPCLERVMWTVFKDMIITSSETMEAFRKLKDVNMLPLSGNFRNIQNETTVHETCIGKVKTN